MLISCALTYAFSLFSDVAACLNFIFYIINSTLPAALQCVYRHSAGCKDGEMSMIAGLKQRMYEELGPYCPQVHCDVCAAHACIAKINKLEKGKDFCR